MTDRGRTSPSFQMQFYHHHLNFYGEQCAASDHLVINAQTLPVIKKINTFKIPDLYIYDIHATPQMIKKKTAAINNETETEEAVSSP